MNRDIIRLKLVVSGESALRTRKVGGRLVNRDFARLKLMGSLVGVSKRGGGFRKMEGRFVGVLGRQNVLLNVTEYRPA